MTAPARLGVVAAMDGGACVTCYQPLTGDVDTDARDVSGPVPFGTVDDVPVYVCGHCARRIRAARSRTGTLPAGIAARQAESR